MKRVYLVFLLFSVISAYSQNQVPIAIPDSAETLAQVPVSINVLLNDYDPEGDPIEISSLLDPEHGENWFQDSVVNYTSEYYSGLDSMMYRVAEIGNPAQQSNFAYIYVNVLENPDVPIANIDSFTVRNREPTELDVMINDYDPNGDEIIIADIKSVAFAEAEISPDSTKIIFYSYNVNHTGFKYRVKERNTDEKYYSDWVGVDIITEENPDLPIAISDYYEAVGGISVALDVLSNDINSLSDTLEFVNVVPPGNNGQIVIDGDTIHYTADTSYTGLGGFMYAIRYKNKPWLYSNQVNVSIDVIKNPNCPIGTADYGSGMAFNPISVEVLSNDFDPNGDLIEIFDIKVNSPFASLSYSGDMVTYISAPITLGPDSAYYRIRKINDHNYYSEWIPIYFDITQNPSLPVANDDFASTKGGIAITIYVLKNDIIHDTLELAIGIISPGPSKGLTQTSDSTITYTPYMSSYGYDSLAYVLYSKNTPPYPYAKGYLYIDIENNHSYDSLTINNINAGIHSGGLLFSRIDEIPDYAVGNYRSHFEVPKGSGKHTIFTNTTWIGGLDNSNVIHLAGERYKCYGNDYQRGPVSNNYDSAYFSNWNGMWKLSKEEVEYHKLNWWKEGYEPIEFIASWPGNGDPYYNQAEQLAPYFDNDNNSIYDPMQGDYPLIRGDQCIFFMYNDDRIHTETEGEPLIIEIHGMAYAIDAPGDSLLNNTIFVHYDLINRSENTYYNSFFGIFADIEIGYADDDYIGSNVTCNSFYSYNGTEVDGNGEPGSYGENPPVQSVTVLAGPYIDPDQEDNPSGGCDYSVNGFNFGNGVIDDERFGLTRFTYHNNAGGPQGDPLIADDYYNYLSGYWLDDTPVIFGGNGHINTAGVGPECRFMFPGDTDPQNWGTDCVLPNDGYNQNGKWWTEEQVGNDPFDRRGIGSCGPFTFHPGDVQEVDIAYVCANSYQGVDSSKNLLKERLYELRQRVLDGEIIIPNAELGISEQSTSVHNFKIYPNPASEVIYVETEELIGGKAEYRIINTMGIVIASGSIMTETKNEINISGLKPGFYIITVITENRIASNKFIKH